MMESLVTTVLMVSVGVVGSRSLLYNTLSRNQVQRQHRAALLSEMVLQQYISYAAQNFQKMDTLYDRDHVEPKLFFNTATNFGYDGFQITTRTTYATNRSTCAVTVDISWVQGARTKNMTFVKIFSPLSQAGGGAAVDIYVCASGNTPQTCVGIPGFAISAPSGGGSALPTGVTDTAGHLTLTSVAMGDQVPFQIAAPTPGDYDHPTGLQGYYATDAFGNYTLTATQAIAVSAIATNTLIVTVFQPMRTVDGFLTNNDRSPGAPLNDLEIAIRHAVLYKGSVTGGFTSPLVLEPGSVKTFTDPLSGQPGYFIFRNVMPTETNTTVAVKGRPGSLPSIRQTDPGFAWGYSGQNFEQQVNSWSLPQPAVGGGVTAPMARITDAVAYKMGWIKFAVTDTSNQPTADIGLTVTLPITQYSTCTYQSVLVPTNGSGETWAYNTIVDNTRQPVQGFGGSVASAMVHGLYAQFSVQTWGLGLGVENRIPVTVQHGYMMVGTMVDDAPGGTLTGATISQTDAMVTNASAAFDGSGNFTMAPYNPNTSLNPYVADGVMSFDQYLKVQNNSMRQLDQVSGQTVDYNTGLPAPNVTLGLQTSDGMISLHSDANGYFSLQANMPLGALIHVRMSCNLTSNQCVICSPLASVCPTGGEVVHVDSRYNHAWFKDIYAHGYATLGAQSMDVAQVGNTLPAQQVRCVLVDRAVQGVVQDVNTHQPIAGAAVIDPNLKTIAVSDANGFYSGWEIVSGRTNATTNTGWFVIWTQRQVVNGHDYFGYSTPNISMPTGQIDPTIPFTNNPQLLENASGGGAM